MFKVNDKIVLNALGMHTYKGHIITRKGAYAKVILIHDKSIVRVTWFNSKNQKISGWQNLNFYNKYFKRIEPIKAYHHPLTPIFAKKMPHFGPPKTIKKRVDKKIFS